MKTYFKLIAGLIPVVIIILFFLIWKDKPSKPIPYSINFIIGEPFTTTSLNDDFTKLFRLKADSIKKNIYIPESCNLTYYFKENNTLDSVIQNIQLLNKIPYSIRFSKSYQDRVEKKLRETKIDSKFLQNSNLSYSQFVTLINSNSGKRKVLYFYPGSDNIDMLIKKRDSILFIQPSSQFLIIYGVPQFTRTSNCNDINSALTNLLKNNNTPEGLKIVTELLQNCFDNESEIYPVDEDGMTKFEPRTAEDFLMDLYTTRYSVKFKIFTDRTVINPKNGKIKTLEFYSERVQDAIKKIQ